MQESQEKRINAAHAAAQAFHIVAHCVLYGTDYNLIHEGAYSAECNVCLVREEMKLLSWPLRQLCCMSVATKPVSLKTSFALSASAFSVSSPWTCIKAEAKVLLHKVGHRSDAPFVAHLVLAHFFGFCSRSNFDVSFVKVSN
jgi:hypothetical protein